MYVLSNLIVQTFFVFVNLVFLFRHVVARSRDLLIDRCVLKGHVVDCLGGLNCFMTVIRIQECSLRNDVRQRLKMGEIKSARSPLAPG